MRSSIKRYLGVSFILTFLLFLTACSKKELRSIPVSSIILNESSVQLMVGENAHLEVSIEPDDATNKTVKWSSSNPTVVSVNDGLVEGVSAGVAVITADADGKTAKCTIKVIPAFVDVESVKLDKSNVSLKAGEMIELTATVNPSDATDKSVAWTSSNPSVATVENGVVKAIKVGITTITAKAGDKTATCSVTVEATPVTSITLDRTAASLKAGQSITLTATVNPSDATYKTVTWTSSNLSVATVENGTVKAVKVGSAAITAKAGDKTATCSVTVEATPVTSITLDRTAASLKAGQSITLIATVNPSDATYKTVTWTSSNPSAATVENGTVKAVKVGSTTITAKAGDKVAICTITVKPLSGGFEDVSEEEWL